VVYVAVFVERIGLRNDPESSIRAKSDLASLLPRHRFPRLPPTPPIDRIAIVVLRLSKRIDLVIPTGRDKLGSCCQAHFLPGSRRLLPSFDLVIAVPYPERA